MKDEARVLEVARQIRAKYPRKRNKGCCLSASHEISEILQKEGFSASIQFGRLDGKTHSWVEVWLGKLRLLDVTADQFGDHYPEILWSTPEDQPCYIYE